MATAIQRASWIADALINGTATAGQRNRLIKAFAPSGAASPHPDTLSNAELAQNFIKEIRQYAFEKMRAYEAAETIRLANQNASAQIDSDFTEQ